MNGEDTFKIAYLAVVAFGWFGCILSDCGVIGRKPGERRKKARYRRSQGIKRGTK